MAATTTPSIDSLLPRLREQHPDITFAAADQWAWNPHTRTISYRADPDEPWQLLHELGHAFLDHREYHRDIELLGLERDAWQHAQTSAAEFDLHIPVAIIDEHLDSYRDWLHARSSCVNCTQTGIQASDHTYACPHCRATWRVNDARTCELRRYRVS